MRDKTRINRILKLLEQHWNKSSDQRFGQLLINLNICDDEPRLWGNEDDAFENYLKALLKDNGRKNDI